MCCSQAVGFCIYNERTISNGYLVMIYISEPDTHNVCIALKCSKLISRLRIHCLHQVLGEHTECIPTDVHSASTTTSVPHPVLEMEEGHSGRLLVLSPTPQSPRRTSAQENTRTLNSVRHNDGLCQLPNCWHVSHTWAWNPAVRNCSSRLRQQTAQIMICDCMLVFKHKI